MDENRNLVPDQRTGAESNTEERVQLTSEQEASEFFIKAAERLRDVNHWHQVAGKATADFELTDRAGNPVQRNVQEGDHFKIDIPGPGPVTGDGYDWVQVEKIEQQQDELTIRVRPATNPNNSRQDVAHFFSDEATSCFMVKRAGNEVVAAVLGRNEKPNTAAEKVVDKARNTAIAGGAITGFAKLQWKSLVKGLLKI